jgi:filamentous hemagglutinin
MDPRQHAGWMWDRDLTIPGNNDHDFYINTLAADVLVHNCGEGRMSWAEQSGILRDAAGGKGNFGLGSATSSEAQDLGEAWVGNGYRIASDGKTLISEDGLRQFRPPTFKPNLGILQANFEQRIPDQVLKQWFSNGHLNITDLP